MRVVYGAKDSRLIVHRCILSFAPRMLASLVTADECVLLIEHLRIPVPHGFSRIPYLDSGRSPGLNGVAVEAIAGIMREKRKEGKSRPGECSDACDVHSFDGRETTARHERERERERETSSSYLPPNALTSSAVEEPK